MTKLSHDAPVFVPNSSFEAERLKQSDAFYHYNILRPTDTATRRKTSLHDVGTPSQGVEGFGGDSKWVHLANTDVSKRAIVLVAGRDEIIRRMILRKHIERGRMKNLNNRYPRSYWMRILRDIDLADTYRHWCVELRSRDIPFVLLDSNSPEYRIVNEEEISDLVNEKSTHYTKEQIQQIIEERDFEYHRVELPYGLHTEGADRSKTRDLIFPDPLKGQSVLDVGCALGYFSFEAEARGAERVVGVELKDSRFQNALLLRDIKQSRVEFRQQNIILDPPEEKFDYVLALNVIHHLHEPFRVLRQLASITKKRMILEFPTLSDKKFKAATGIKISFFYDKLPLVGVSSMSKADQTFVFSPSAIRQALTEHEKLFRKIQIVRSPMKGRVIAICRK